MGVGGTDAHPIPHMFVRNSRCASRQESGPYLSVADAAGDRVDLGGAYTWPGGVSIVVL